jgi:hypothetical protein
MAFSVGAWGALRKISSEEATQIYYTVGEFNCRSILLNTYPWRSLRFEGNSWLICVSPQDQARAETRRPGECGRHKADGIPSLAGKPLLFVLLILFTLYTVL